MRFHSHSRTWAGTRFLPKVFATLMALALWPPLSGGSVAFAGGSEKSKTVVVLYPDADDGRPGGTLTDRAIRSTFAAATADTIEVHNEHLDLSRFTDNAYQQHLAEFLRRKYAGRKIDLVIAFLTSGLDFALKYREQAFPGVPIVHCAVDQWEIDARQLPADVIGIPIKMEMAATLDLALRFHPKTERVYVISGKSKFDVQWDAEVRRAFQPYRDRVEFIHLAGLPLPELLKRVAELPEHSIVYYLHVFEDGDGKILIPVDALKLVEAQANAPIYGHVDTCVGRGIVGGRVFSFETAGHNAAAIGLRILAGEKPQSIPIREVSTNSTMFDWRQLRRWGISEASLPPGSIVRHHEPSFWYQYRWHILAVISLCVVETLLIIGLVVQRASRRRAEAGARQNQAELRELTGRLLQAQETERRRIARELHDDLSQGLAFLAVELDMMHHRPPASISQVGERMQKLSGHVKQLSSTIHGLSHQLHPAKLEQLGLVAAVRGLCNDMTENHGLPIEFTHNQIPERLPEDTALCLYRIAQESLQNVVRHSAAGRAVVELSGHADAICARVIDDGKGFDASLGDSTWGLGLVSMRERLYLVGGRMTIDSKKGGGTRIEAHVPLRSEDGSTKPAAFSSPPSEN